MTHLPGLEIGLILHERTAVQIKSGIYRLREKGEAVCLSRKNLNDFSFTFTLSKSHQFSSVAQSCLTLCDPMDCSMPGLPVHPQLLELAQTQVHWVSDAIQPPHSLLSPSPPAFNLSQHQSFPASQFFTSGDQSTGISVSALILPVKFRTDFL